MRCFETTRPVWPQRRYVLVLLLVLVLTSLSPVRSVLVLRSSEYEHAPLFLAYSLYRVFRCVSALSQMFVREKQQRTEQRILSTWRTTSLFRFWFSACPSSHMPPSSAKNPNITLPAVLIYLIHSSAIRLHFVWTRAFPSVEQQTRSSATFFFLFV